MDLNETAVFVKVVQAGGFSAAARQLDLPTSTVSTRVARLEKRLGVTLLQRTTRRLHLTEAGELFYRHAAVGLDHMLEAEAAVAAVSGSPRGRLRLTAPSDFGDDILAGLVDALRVEHPAIHIELTLTDRLVDLVAEGVDVAIRAGELEDSTLVAKRVGIACWAPVASPDYLQGAPSLARPQDLQGHRCLQFTSLGRDHWQLADAHGEVVVPLSGELVVNDMGIIRTQALAGRGIALLPTYVCRREIREGRLLRVLPGWRAKADPVHLVYPRQRFVPPKLRAFMDVAAPLLQEWVQE